MSIQNQALKRFLDDLAEEMFGLTRTEAHREGLCVNCKQPISSMKMEGLDMAEWKISALCPKCFIEHSGGDIPKGGG